MLILFAFSILSLLLSIIQSEIIKRKLYVRSPVFFQSSDILHKSEEEILTYRKQLLRNELFHHIDIKLTKPFLQKRVNNNTEQMDNLKANDNLNIDKKPQGQLLQTSFKHAKNWGENHNKNMSKHHQQQPRISSSELALSKTAKNSSHGKFKYIAS